MMIHRRGRIVSGQNLVRGAVAVLTLDGHAVNARVSVLAAIKGGLFVGVAVGAGRPWTGGLAGRVFHRLVAILAGEEISVDRMAQLGLIDVEADLLVAIIPGQRRLGVAGEAACVLRIRRRIRDRNPGKQG
jgi:hypothetical protein